MPLLLTETATRIDPALIKEIGVVVFFLVFAGIAVWLLFSRSDKFSKIARIPLDDTSVEEPRATPGEPTSARK